MRRRKRLRQFGAVFMLMLCLAACGAEAQPEPGPTPIATEDTEATEATKDTEAAEATESADAAPARFSYDAIPPWDGAPAVIINGNEPDFSDLIDTAEAFAEYAPLDALGRCGPAVALLGPELLPTEERGEIGQIRPSGWHTVKYAGIDGNYLYNRCHLIAFSLAGENANERNLITGTRYLNTAGMQPYEQTVEEYIRRTENHVRYRVTPVFLGEELVARGVLMEAQSVEDEGIGLAVFCYNIQPEITIDYRTGESEGPEPQATEKTALETAGTESEQATYHYILNTNTKKFHYPDCKSVSDMKEKNKQSFTGTREEALALGYTPCGNCRP